MISKITIAVSTVIILAGLFSFRTKTVGRKMLLLCISEIGAVALAYAQLNAYGLVGGTMQVLFRVISTIFVICLIMSICRKNEIKQIEDFNGIGKQMPYEFLLISILSVIVIGLPATGTFTGLIYSEIGLLAGGYGIFTYIGLVGNVLAIIVPAVILTPMIRRAYFPEAEAECKEIIGKISKALFGISAVVAIALVVLCIYQKPVMTFAGFLIEKILG